MANKESLSFTQRLGGNRTIVLGIVIVMLILFTVDLYVVPALGGGGGGGEFIRFTVNGRTVEVSRETFQGTFADWQRFQQGQGMVTGRARGNGMEDYLQDRMINALARKAGVAVTDGTLLEFIQTHPLFTDRTGAFDPAAFESSRERFFGNLSARAFEQEARKYLLGDHYLKIYANSFLAVSDGECYQRWKGDHPKVEVAYAWQPVAPLREGLSEADLATGELETFWADKAVQARHRVPDRRAFDAAVVVVEEVTEEAHRAAREEWKDDPELVPAEDEAFLAWNQARKFDFNTAALPAETRARLRAENEPRIRAAEKAARGDGGEDAPEAPDPYAFPVEDLDPRSDFDLYWRARMEREVFLRRLMEKVRKEMKERDVPAAAAAETWSRPGLPIRAIPSPGPVDQYGVEAIEGLGGANCPLRYTLNSLGADKVGVVHADVLQRTASTDVPGERGWVVFRLTEFVPAVVPPLEDVREKVLGELLDARAREKARARLVALRRDAEASRADLADAAGKAGLEAAEAGPFNEYSWRPPLPRAEPGAPVEPVADHWKDAGRRVSAVMGRYFIFREVPVGAFSEVIDDADGSGAFYLVQVRARTEPAFEEMTLAMIHQVRRVIARERLQDLGRELSYAGLKDKLNLHLEGKPAPDAEELRGRR